MSKSLMISFVILTLTFALLISSAVSVRADAIVADHTAPLQFDDIPVSIIQEIQTGHKMFYGHTSHGNQILAGMNVLRIESGTYDYDNGETFPIDEYTGDLGYDGDTAWAPVTRAHLDQPGNTTNVVMWSWCGGVSWNTEAGINIYLAKMSELEAQYPEVTFIYQTGHLDGMGPTGTLYICNNQIRNYCLANNKILFDFADIESWDPDGIYYPMESDACGWCSDWCATRDCPLCVDIGCSHSHDFNCYQKGKAFWWLMANLVGWSLSVDVESQTDPRLPSDYHLSQNYPNPFNPGTEIRYICPLASHVTLEVFNIAGQKVATLVDGRVSPGRHSVWWNGEDDSGKQLASGIYFYRLEAGEFAATRKMILLK